jgi:transcriptional regulator of NAD metabolism
MRSKEWAYLLDLLVNIVANNYVYSEVNVQKLQKLIDCVNEMESEKERAK